MWRPSAGLYDLAAFLAEQAARLRLHGGYPRVHSIRYLLSTLAYTPGELGGGDAAAEIARFVRVHRELLIAPAEAYIEARYGLGRYTRGELEELMRLVGGLSPASVES